MQNRNKELLLERALKEFRPDLIRIAAKLVDTQNAEDVVQEVAKKATSTINSFEGKSSIKTWLIRITINESTRFRKALKRIRDHEVLSINAERFDCIDEGQFGKALDGVMLELSSRVFRRLTPMQRAIVRLRGEGLTLREIGVQVGLSESSVRYHIKIAENKTTTVLKDQIGTYEFDGFMGSLDRLDLDERPGREAL